MKDEMKVVEGNNNDPIEWVTQKNSQFVNRYGVSLKKTIRITVPEYQRKRDGVMNIDPKVNEPYEQIPRRISREQMIEKIRNQFLAVKIEELLRKNNVDFSNKDFNRSNLDLPNFDNKNYDIYPNEYWLTKAVDETNRQLKLQANCLMYDKTSKTGYWKKVFISGYDSVTDTFSGVTDDKDKIPFQGTPKLYVLFDVENPFVFCKRLLEALKLREYSENRIKYIYYLSKIPKYDIDALPEHRMNRIINMVSNMEEFDIVEEEAKNEITQINSSYVYSINKMMFDDLYFNKKSSELCSFSLKLPPVIKSPSPYYAKQRISAASYSFDDINKTFGIKYVLCKKHVCEAMFEIKKRNNKMQENLSLYNVKILTTMKLEEFKSEQRRNFSRFKSAIEHEEIGEIKKILKRIENKERQGLNFEIDFVAQKYDKKKKNVFEEDEKKEKYIDIVMSKINDYKTNNLINMINAVMRDSLYKLVCKSLIAFINFFEDLIPSVVDVKGSNSVKNNFDNDKQTFPKIKNISKIYLSLDENSAFAKKTDSPDEDLNTTKDNLEKENVSNSKISKTKFPIFHLFLRYKDDQFMYNYRVEDAVADIKKLFDEGLDKIQKIPLINLDESKDAFFMIKYFDIIHRDKHKGDANTNNSLNMDSILVINKQTSKENMEWVGELYERLGNSLLLAKEPINTFLQKFDSYKDHLKIVPEQYIKVFEDDTTDPTIIGKIREDIIKNKKFKDTIYSSIPEEISVSFFLVNCKEIRDTLITKFEKIIDLEIDLLILHSRKLKTSVNAQCEAIKKEILKPSKNIDELVAIERYIDEVPMLLENLKFEIEGCMNIYKVLDEFLYKVQFLELRQRYMLLGAPTEILNTISNVKSGLNKQRERFLEELVDNQRKLNEEILTVEKKTHDMMNFNSLENLHDAAQLARILENSYQDSKEKARVYNNREVHFGREQTDYNKIAEMYKEFEPFWLIWTNIDTFINKTQNFLTQPFSELKGEDVKSMNDNVLKNLNASIRKLRDKDAKNFAKIIETAEEIKKQAEEFKPIANLSVFLTTEGMDIDRHWVALKNDTGIDCLNKEGLSLESIVNSLTVSNDILRKAENISEKAFKEHNISVQLKKLESRWAEVNFILVPYRTGTSTIGGWGDVYTILDEDVLEVQQLEASQFKGHFLDDISSWSAALLNITNILEVWKRFQQKWLQLQPIFESSDINKSIPHEAKKFMIADKNWKDLIKFLKENLNVKTVCARENLFKQINESNILLEEVERGLNDYIEKKKGIFPRFYFISNEDLIEIISQTKDLNKIKENLKKIFENIHYIKLKDEKIIIEMLSNLQESVALRDTVSLQGKNVEVWMKELESSMFTTVRYNMDKAITSYTKTPRDKWLFDHSGQSIIHASQLHWTNEVENAVEKNSLNDYVNAIQEKINFLVKIVRGHLSRVNSITISNLLTLEVHNKDVTQTLVENFVSDVFSFEWIKQLRYYWEKNDCIVKSIQTSFPYGYEYLGNTEILVITPLTDKCYLTLMGALKFNMGGAPAGPAGTGKTESTKDLAKAIAKQCIVYNCSEETDYNTVAKFFKGLACCGAWICFDEFNRINIEVLSVIAQQLIYLFWHKEQGLKTTGPIEIVFEKSTIQILPTFCVFITMNPDYEGRTALPDNLIALFRPMAMMVPDYKLIAQVYLYSCGYFTARELSKKVVSTFKLSSEQLSSQSHYDFGMRAVKSVLYAAKKLKRQNTDIDEDKLLLRALEDVNVPKFLSEDIPLFQSIIRDLFPTTERPKSDLDDLISKIKQNCQKDNIQPTDNFIKKIIQLYDTIQVRHGLMIVGPTGGGKSTNWKTLQKSLSDLNDGVRYFKTETVIINPKSIKKEQLFCEKDPNTLEYMNGILPINVIKINQDTASKSKYWILFDGPVDTLWIEDMNSVLDDSKKLCLSSSAIIVLNENITMMFEVEDLTHASPATVSRCGMVFMEPSAIGLLPLAYSWINTIPPNLQKSNFDLKGKLKELFEYILEDSVKFTRKKIKEPCPSTNNNLAESLMRILDCFLERYRETENNKVSDFDIEILYKSLTQVYFFSTIWSIGITCKEDGRIKFDAYIKQKMEEKYPDSLVPTEGTVYDYSFDVENGQWAKWELNYPILDPRAIYTDIIIPTIDSVRYSYLIKMLVNNNKHLITTGPTGTGKTVNMMDVLSKAGADKVVSLILNFSAQTTALQTQESIDSKLTPKSRTTRGPKEKKMIIFVDDLNMPKKEKYEAQPPIEIVRQWLDYGGWYDLLDKEKPFKWIVNIMFVGAMGPPGGGRSFLSNRFMRHFNLIAYTELVDDSIKTIFERKVTHFIGRFSDKVKEIVPHIVSSTLELYKDIKSTLLPIPKSSHYLFNLRDMSKVLQGVCSANMKYTQNKIDLVKIWLHEMTRSFGDRLICEEDRKWLKDVIDGRIEKVKEFEIEKIDKVYEGVEKIIFCDFVIGNDRPYVQVSNIKQFIAKIENYLLNYNEESKGKPMQLVMFLNACDHVARICRVIRQEQGHALLLGVGGSGRQSLARLSAFINNMECSQIEVFKGYKMEDFKKNVKDSLMSSGVKEKQNCFLICDTQIFNELMLEDLNNCLNSGDVPDLYKFEDLEEIRSACKSDCARKGLQDTPTNIFSVYLQRVRSNIHIILAMSPVGEMFVTRLRMFPSLVNCCTIDWFTEWPDEALQSVAKDTLERNDMGLGSTFAGCIDTIKFIHKSVEKLSIEYLQELRRYNYLTPTSFLEFLNLFQSILDAKRKENLSNTNRLENGLQVLAFAGEKIQQIEKEIKIKTPILEETTIKVNEFIEVLKVNKAEADIVRAEATEERAKAEELNKQITELDERCSRELNKAEQDLSVSLRKIELIDDNDLRQIGNTRELSQKMERIVELLLIFRYGDEFRSHKHNLVKDGDFKTKVSFLNALRTDLNGTDVKLFKGFFESFKDPEKREYLKNKELHKVYMARDFINNQGIDKKYVETAASAILGCFDFILAMIDFCDKSLNVVDPLKKEAAVAKDKKVYADEALRTAEEKLRVAETTANKLEKEYNEQQKYKNDLAFEISENTTKMERAKSLVHLLSGEKTRWAENVDNLKSRAGNLIGDCLISAAMIAYSGAFTSKYRSKFEELWIEKLSIEKIPCTDKVSLREVMEDKLETRKWNINQLPNDNLSIENGIIMFKTRKWPLMIDPQNQASIFLKKYGFSQREASFQCVKMSDPKMIEQTISGVKFGYWILLDNVGLNLDTSLEPILLQQKIKRGNYCEIKIGDKIIPYNEDFKLFMITTISNPHYSPETFAKITIINFAITQIGLEDQMLSELVRIEMPELEENKNKILEENFKSQEILKEIEDRILDNLTKNKDNIEETLKTSDLIDILTEAKIKSTEISQKMLESEKTGKEIDRKREIYRPSALRSSILFFILIDLAYIDPMYQYSLLHFKRLFSETVRNLQPCDDINLRIIDINRKFCKDFYDYTCRSLFEKDKILFSFVMCCKVLMGEQKEGEEKIKPNELRFLLAGPSSDVEVTYPDNPTNWISSNDWKSFYSQLFGMTRLHPDLADIEKFFMKNHNAFKVYYETPKNENSPLPEPYNSKLNEFLKLIVIKALRYDKFINSLIFFVEKNLGKEFIEPPAFDLNKSYKDSNFSIPLLFVLSTGSDPKNDFQQLAETLGRKVDYVSLGKSMDKYAVSKIEDMKLKGGWILLQNCHLSLSFMPKLEDIIEQLQNNSSLDPNFRLWLTSMSSSQFSINVLKNSIKITMEPPKGLKLNLQRQYNNIRDDDLEACSKPEQFKTLFFSLCFFHAIVQDRRKFGPIGWNVKYDFTNEDLKVSRLQLKNFLEEYEEVPYKVLNYLVAEINYGGRVTDDKDQKLIRTILNSFLNADVLNNESFKLSESGLYYCPAPGSRTDYISHVKTFPQATSPEVFGMHDNAEIVTAQNDASILLETVLGMQPRTSSGTGKSTEQVVTEILQIIEQNIPPPFDIESVKTKYPTLYEESMNTVLVQEVYRYNTLLLIMKKQIKNLKKALLGKIVMSDEMDRIATSLYNNQVPQIWIKVGFLSLKPLMGWIGDLKERIEFFDNWINNGTPKAFCLPSKNIFLNLGFSFPQAFLTGTLQNFARKHHVEIDLLSFEFKILDLLNPLNVRERPADGCYVYGMYLEGARWDYKTHKLDHSKNRELYTDVPLIQMVPVANRKTPETGIYICPLYKVLSRQGTLSTTGHSTNFVLFVELPSGLDESVWIKAGVAMFLALKQ